MANKYDKKFASYLDATFKTALEALSLKGGEKILDVACGTGGLEKIILERFDSPDIIGIDITRSMLKLAQDKCAGYKNVKFVQMHSQDLKFDDKTFDVVVTCSAFHYMRDPDEVLFECQRVLKTGGRLILIDWCRDFLWAKFYNWLSKIYKRAHYKVYTLKEIKRLLTEAGFTATNSKTFAIPPFWRMMCVEAKKERSSKWLPIVGG